MKNDSVRGYGFFQTFFHMGNRLSPSFEWKQWKLLLGHGKHLVWKKEGKTSKTYIQIGNCLLFYLLPILWGGIFPIPISLYFVTFLSFLQGKRKQVNEKLCKSCILHMYSYELLTVKIKFHIWSFRLSNLCLELILQISTILSIYNTS